MSVPSTVAIGTWYDSPHSPSTTYGAQQQRAQDEARALEAEARGAHVKNLVSEPSTEQPTRRRPGPSETPHSRTPNPAHAALGRTA